MQICFKIIILNFPFSLRRGHGFSCLFLFIFVSDIRIFIFLLGNNRNQSTVEWCTAYGARTRNIVLLTVLFVQVSDVYASRRISYGNWLFCFPLTEIWKWAALLSLDTHHMLYSNNIHAYHSPDTRSPMPLFFIVFLFRLLVFQCVFLCARASCFSHQTPQCFGMSTADFL